MVKTALLQDADDQAADRPRLHTVTRPIITPVVTRSHRWARSMRPGSPTTRTTRRTTRTAE